MIIDKRLVQLRKDARDWEKRATSIPGLFIPKLPGLRGNPLSVVLEINPVDPTKKRGIIIRFTAELHWIKGILSNPKIAELAENLDRVNPQKREATPSKTGTDIFEV